MYILFLKDLFIFDIEKGLTKGKKTVGDCMNGIENVLLCCPISVIAQVMFVKFPYLGEAFIS